MAKLSITFPTFRFVEEKEDFITFLGRMDNLLTQLIYNSENLPEGKIAGAVISFPVADGKAFYLVTKERPLTLQHIPVGDAYKIDEAYIRGLKVKDIKNMIARDRAMRVLFSTHKREVVNG